MGKTPMYIKSKKRRKGKKGCVWWLEPVILAPRRLRHKINISQGQGGLTQKVQAACNIAQKLKAHLLVLQTAQLWFLAPNGSSQPTISLAATPSIFFWGGGAPELMCIYPHRHTSICII